MRICFTLLILSVLAVAQPADPGGRQYETRCARCHGGDATGGESGPNIVAQLDARNDQDLATFLRSGRPANGMPAFDLVAAEMNDLVRYLRTLQPISRSAPRSTSRRSVTLTDGTKLEGQTLSEGMTDLQIRTDDHKIRLLRKSGDRYREVTSQTDWPTYHGDPSGNRYTKLTQINKTNVAGLAPKWVFPIPNVGQVETTPLVIEGIMYVSSANECWGLDAGFGPGHLALPAPPAPRASPAMQPSAQTAASPWRARPRVHAYR